MDWGQDTGCIWRPVMEKMFMSIREGLGVERRATRRQRTIIIRRSEVGTSPEENGCT